MVETAAREIQVRRWLDNIWPSRSGWLYFEFGLEQRPPEVLSSYKILQFCDRNKFLAIRMAT